ncbi:flagellar motor protein MotB [Granulicella arctica]|uniref:flagellar motor protein MotB n=1 Tax=Granulicella arctica TaxID=940613 RepID=UPI0021DFFE0B|nr:flagellar motor protein MotB [Granulicella arctica]
MSRKKHPEHVNHERWLVSYADFITLLFAFFVVLFASGQSDKKKQTQLAAAMQAAFSPVSMFEPHSKKPALTQGAAAAETIEPVAPPVPSPHSMDRTAAGVRKILEEQKKSAGLPPGSLTMHTTSEGLVISLQEAGFFTSGSAEVQQQSRQVLMKIAAALPAGPMRIEGHTDTVPIHTEQFATNWELSSERAIVIARYLFENGPVSPADLAVTGYAEFHPIASNATPEGRARNRRVDIILLSHPAALR